MAIGQSTGSDLPGAATTPRRAKPVVMAVGKSSGSEVLLRFQLSDQLRMAGFVTLDRSPDFDYRVTGKVEDLESAGSKARVRFDLTMVRPDASVVATWVETLEGDSTQRVIQQAAKEAAAAFKSKLLAVQTEQETMGASLPLTVDGVASQADLDALSRFLSTEIPGVKGVADTALVGKSATLQVVFTGSTDDLAGALSGKRFKGKKLHIVRMDQSGVGIAVGK